MKNVVLYYCTNTIQQDIAKQFSDLKEYCIANNFKILKEFEEKESGIVKTRKGKAELLDFCEFNQVDFVIISEFSRFGRTQEVLNIYEKLNSLKVCLLSLKENFRSLHADLTVNKNSELMLGIAASLATYEETTRQHFLKAGMIKSVKAGGAGAGYTNPFGFFIEKETKKLRIDEKEAAIVREIFDMYTNQNKSTNEIAEYLNSIDLPSQHNIKWSKQTIRYMLKNTFYKGERNFFGEIYKMPAIIDAELFDKANLLLKSNRKYQHESINFNYLFHTGVVRCGVCGRTFVCAHSCNSVKYRYICVSRSAEYKERCENIGIALKKVEESVFEFLRDTFLPDLLVKKDISNLVAILQKIENGLIIYQKELKAETSKEKKLVDLYLNGKIDINIYNTKLEDIKIEQDIINKSIDTELVNKEEVLKKIELGNNIDVIREDWKKNGMSRDLLKRLITKVVITKAEEVHLMPGLLDKVVRVDVYSGQTHGAYYISQRSMVLRPFISMEAS